MTARYTSRVFAAGRALFESVQSAVIPPHPVTNETPDVCFGDEAPDAGAERIAISLDVEETENAWARLSPPGRDEPMVFVIVTFSYVPVPEQTTLDVWDRLDVLSGAVEDRLYDRTQRRLIELGFDGEVPTGRVSSVAPIVFPTPQGPMGRVVHTVRLLANI